MHPGQAPNAHHGVQQPAHQQTPNQSAIPQVVQPPQVSPLFTGESQLPVFNQGFIFRDNKKK